MPRTTPSDVLVTFDADADDPEVNQWIAQASLIVDDVDAAASVTDARLEQIELLLTQHFLAAQYPRFTSQSGGSRSADFGEGREGQAYLARAKRLDPTGVVEESLEADKFTLSTG
jgi:hypothetical protein